MIDSSVLLSATLFLAIGALYASVGHAGSSGYLALLTFLGVQANAIRPAALLLNLLVATIAFIQFRRAGHLRWRLAGPFCAGSAPAAFLGGRSALPPMTFNIAIGAVLLVAAARIPACGGERPRRCVCPGDPDVMFLDGPVEAPPPATACKRCDRRRRLLVVEFVDVTPDPLPDVRSKEPVTAGFEAKGPPTRTTPARPAHR